MFQAVSPPIIRSSRTVHIAFGMCQALLAATASGSSKQAWHTPDAVCTVFELLMMDVETARTLTVIKNIVQRCILLVVLKRIQHLLKVQLRVSAPFGPSSGCTRMYTDKMYNCVYTLLLTYLFTYVFTYSLIYLLTYLFTYLLTYLLTPCSLLLEKLTSSQLVNKFLAFYGTRRFITAFTSAHHLYLSWARLCT